MSICLGIPRHDVMIGQENLVFQRSRWLWERAKGSDEGKRNRSPFCEVLFDHMNFWCGGFSWRKCYQQQSQFTACVKRHAPPLMDYAICAAHLSFLIYQSISRVIISASGIHDVKSTPTQLHQKISVSGNDSHSNGLVFIRDENLDITVSADGPAHNGRPWTSTVLITYMYLSRHSPSKIYLAPNFRWWIISITCFGDNFTIHQALKEIYLKSMPIHYLQHHATTVSDNCLLSCNCEQMTFILRWVKQK